MTSDRKSLATIASVLALGAATVAGYLVWAGPDDESVRFLLRLSARVAFAVFVLVFIARPLFQLLPTPLTRGLLRSRRQLGLTVGALMALHLGLIGWRFGSSAEFNLDASAIFGAVSYTFMALMVLTSFDAAARFIGPKLWRRLHGIGIWFIAIPFVSTLLPETREQLLEPEYIGFTLLIAVAAVIRLTAFFAQRQGN
ncbi:MAG: ferric reductase-like transmembrane domain-containing protein [Woeseiaceae bacterium]|nr:ferric reductase-like transmembrane domain-containing protein [Woeseiaceae bacterium]